MIIYREVEISRPEFLSIRRYDFEYRSSSYLIAQLIRIDFLSKYGQEKFDEAINRYVEMECKAIKYLNALNRIIVRKYLKSEINENTIFEIISMDIINEPSNIIGIKLNILGDN